MREGYRKLDLETEEETQLRNHLKWARIRIKGDGADIPKEVTIDGGEICYTMQIWTESPVRVVAGEDRNTEVITQRIRGGEPLGKDENLLQSQKATNTAGESRVLTEENGQILKINKGVGRGESNSKQSPIQRWKRLLNQPAIKDVGENSGVQKSPEEGWQIQQIHDVEPVSIQSTGDQTDAEVEASNWGETHTLLMKIDERKRGMEKKGENSEAATPRHRGIGKNELKNLQGINKISTRNLVKSSLLKWRADVYCFQETKISKDVDRIAKQLWASRWMRCGYIEADGSSGGVLIMWDSRIWVGSSVEEGKFSITYKFEAVQDGFCWFLTGVYAPHTRTEKLECWEEIAAVRELSGGPWVTCGDLWGLQLC
ncbi:hypothetical protein H5410_037512 [Solanum commersonii]|uniref:Uncharacterized protein n=1 Tax=Solanum commersonii TaxID=4109 RepID=A0A9J5Y9R3_SOLCO|nr:hypothetical protein H5410_037512 [Solanum commersonii]